MRVRIQSRLFYDTEVEKNVFLKKCFFVYFVSSLHEGLKVWEKKPSAVNDPFLRAILTFLRTKIAALPVYRSLKDARGKPIFPIFCDIYDYETSSFT
jgi:hypothetical protein